MKLSSSIKGLITAALMVVVFLLIYQADKNSDQNKNAVGNSLQYIVYAIYGAGIVWTLLSYRQSPAFTGKFGDNFQQGFRCFVVVTLAMALFYGIFNALHPEFSEQMAVTLREQLTNEKGKLPSEIDEAVAAFKKQYTLKLVSGAIFGYLIIGAGITAVLSALLNRRN